MISFVPISISHQEFLTKWFENDIAGQKELSSYMNIDAWLKLLNPASRFGWIVFDDKKAIGFADLEKKLSGIGSFSFYISLDERGKGKSKQLLLALIEKAKELGIRQLHAGVAETNITSQNALTSVGFIQGGKDKDNYLIFQFNL